MKMNTKFSSLVAALLASSSSRHGVDAATALSETVTCIAEAPTICIGSAFFATPSPASFNGTTTYIGGYSFTYDFMTGLENYNGTFLSDLDPDVVAQARETTLEVSVSIDDDGICMIDVGNETCSTCSTDDCNGGEDDNDNDSTEDTPISVSFDCTNIQNGRASQTCESLTYDGLFYPLMYNTSSSSSPNNDGSTSMSKEDNESTNVEGLTVDNNGGNSFPTDAEQNTPNGNASDASPAEGGDYQSQDTLPENTAQLCITNAVGATCPTGAELPDIACCTSGVTGAFFNACCPANFAGIQMGTTGATDTNEFEMVILNGLGVAESADCVVNDNKQGCQIFDVPGNEVVDSQEPLNLPSGVEGPCIEIESGASCSTHQGTCNTADDGTGRTSFSVCCPTCATGTYLPGQSCSVTLPDPASCGYNIDPTMIAADTEQDVTTTTTTTTTATKEDNDTDDADIGVMGTAQDLPPTTSSSSATAINYFAGMAVVVVVVTVITTTATTF